MERKDWIGLLGRTKPAALRTAAASLGEMPQPDWLRRPETGSVMVRGRTGGTGAAFNLGEVTATRCALRLEGKEGHAIVQGRDADHATRAAWIDALMQGARADEVRRTVLVPLADAERERRDTSARKAEATRVDFETMVRGED
ncbi:MAG: phosphonate C-P lyase system protein PhnG [Pseudomonadota bacterium]